MNRNSAEERVLMRLILALDASSTTYAVAVGAEERPRVQRGLHRDDPAFAGLAQLVADALTAANAVFSDIGTIAVDVGPGGRSSIRAAVAYANGLAFSLGVRIFPVNSLELMAIAAAQAYRGPVLSLKRSYGTNTFAGLFLAGQVAEMRHGPANSVVPAMAAGLEKLHVAGASRSDVADLIPGVTVSDTRIAEADVAILYQEARVAMADPERLVSAASPLTEVSRIFHEPAREPSPDGNGSSTVLS
jgi:tRNA threonylcarbamoyladenosine biosynthesis protein TsaB